MKGTPIGSEEPRAMGARVGVVIIARNEGERLARCVAALQNDEDFGACPMVYVDSGSDDGSRAMVRARGIAVHELAPPVGMARARNAGFEILTRAHPELEFVQFIDGDCEIVSGWGAAALIAFDAGATVREHAGREPAIVCGRRREKYPETSLYNRMIDQEWDRPIGDAEACGGDFMIRVESFAAIGGFRESLICGEEPEMCLRLRGTERRVPRRVVRIAAEMTVHDAALHSFKGWWRRSVRGGWAYAEALYLHGRRSGYRLRECLRILFYGAGLPLASCGAAALAFATGPVGSVACAFAGPILYAALFARIFWRQARAGVALRDAWRIAGLGVLDKFAGLGGMLLFVRRTLSGGPQRLIEYKNDSRHRKLKSAVIGTGVIAEEHLAYLETSAFAELIAICDLSPAAARAAANRYGAPRTYADWRAMLRETRPEVVHILTPPATHFEIAAACLDAGCNVVVEKPAALALKDLKCLLEIADERGVALLENHNYRFNETMRELEGRVRAGSVGDVVDLEIRMALPLRLKAGRYSDPNLAHPSHRLGAGVIHEFLTHLCYLALRFVPDEYQIEYAGLTNLGRAAHPEWIAGETSDAFQFDDLDVSLTTRLDRGVRPMRARIRFCAYSQPAEFSVTVRGTRGALSTDLFHPCLIEAAERDLKGLSQVLNQIRGGATLLRAGLGNLKRKLLRRTPYEGLATLLNEYYAAIAVGTPSPVSPGDMLGTAELMDRILEHANSKKVYA